MEEIKETLNNIPEGETSRQPYLEISSEIGKRLLENLDQPFYPSDLGTRWKNVGWKSVS